MHCKSDESDIKTTLILFQVLQSGSEGFKGHWVNDMFMVGILFFCCKEVRDEGERDPGSDTSLPGRDIRLIWVT